MPRLDYQQYYERHTLLGILAADRNRALSRLRPVEISDLHVYFAPAVADINLRMHRRKITQRHPSLPQRAGRAWAKLQRLRDLAAVPIVGSKRRPRHAIVSGVELRPQPDYDKFVRALLRAMRDNMKS